MGEWVGGCRALFASPALTCNAPIRPPEGSPDHVTSERGRRIPDHLHFGKKRVFGFLLLKTCPWVVFVFFFARMLRT